MPAVLRQNEEVLHEIIAVQAANVVAKNSCRARKPGLEFQEASHISVLILSTFHIFSLMQFGQLPDFLAITRRTLLEVNGRRAYFIDFHRQYLAISLEFHGSRCSIYGVYGVYGSLGMHQVTRSDSPKLQLLPSQPKKKGPMAGVKC